MASILDPFVPFRFSHIHSYTSLPFFLGFMGGWAALSVTKLDTEVCWDQISYKSRLSSD